MSDDVKVTWHAESVKREDREAAQRHSSCLIWFTGLSGCGKSTIANLVDHQLFSRGVRSFVLDGDNLRHGLSASPARLAEDHRPEFAERFGLGFSADDREENIRRIGCVAQLLVGAGVVTLAAFVSPYRRDRDAVRSHLEKWGRPGDFVEVHVNTPLEICEVRDPKGLYRQARAGKIKGFTGIDDPYEAPLHPELVLGSSGTQPAESLAQELLSYLEQHHKIPRQPTSHLPKT